MAKETQISRLAIALLGHAVNQASARRQRLFAVACCRLIWSRLSDPVSRNAVEIAERFADELATIQDLDAIRRVAYQVRDSSHTAKIAGDTAKRNAHQAAQMAAHVLNYTIRDEQASQLSVFLDIFGNTPFRGLPRPGECGYTMNRDCDPLGNDFQPVLFSHEWRTSTVLSLAEGIYISRDFSGMQVLADALQETGCEDPKILEHCRSGELHSRGCWVLDGLLGRN